MKKIRAQIMVIVLVLMSVLSIIALSVTISSIRDKQEKTQNSQYQEYYSMGENMLLNFQQTINRKSLDLIDNSLAVDIGSNVTADCNPVNTLSKKCVFNNIDASLFDPQKQETLKSTVIIEDSLTITGFLAEKDKDIMLDIASASLPTKVRLSWTGSSSTAWNITVDKTDYSSEKTIYNKGTTIFSTEVKSYTGSCMDYTSSIDAADKTTVEITLKCANKMYLRLRPIIKVGTGVTIDLSVDNNTIPLMRTLTNTVVSNNTTNPDNPVVVLETKYLLIAQPLSLFDYVLRTESDLVK